MGRHLGQIGGGGLPGSIDEAARIIGVTPTELTAVVEAERVGTGQEVHLDTVGQAGDGAGESMPAGDLERQQRRLVAFLGRAQWLLDATDLRTKIRPAPKRTARSTGTELTSPPS